MKEIITPWASALHNDSVKQSSAVPEFLVPDKVKYVRHFHETLENYTVTPLVRLNSLAKHLGVREIFIKDESNRFGLKAFKGLGGVYALTRVVCKALNLDFSKVRFADLKTPQMQARLKDMVFVTATDGNHGKGIAWAAGQLGCKAYVYMPKGSSPLRAQAIRDAGQAEVKIMDTSYDDTVQYAAKMAEKHGWFLVQDTSWEGYEEVPRWIIQGYTTMAGEAAEQLEKAGYNRPTHVFLQAGVGAMAGGVLGYLAHRYQGNRPLFAIAEPDGAACIYHSAKVDDGKPHAADGDGITIMAGLNCGEPCTLTWPVLRDLADWYFSCPDFVAAYGMRLLGAPLPGDTQIISGESGAVTAGLLALVAGKSECAKLRERMGLNQDSVVLLFNTESDTDPVHYKQVVHEGKLPLPVWQAGSR